MPCQDIKIQCLDLFCGAGGLTYGLEEAGIQVCLGLDHDPACETPYENNTQTPFFLADVADVAADDLRRVWGDDAVRGLVGCAPCQPFSTLTNGCTQTDESRWSLLGHFGRLVQETNPHLVAMENVPALHKDPVFHDFCHTLATCGYRIACGILNCVDYEVPQERKRLVLLASRLGQIKLPAPFNPFERKTVRDVIEFLPALETGDVCDLDMLHQASHLSPVNMERIRISQPGGDWRDWPEDMVSPCHRRLARHSYTDVYGRMEWDHPSPTITGSFYLYGCGRFGHPAQDRALSLREGALLQSFPVDYKFVPDGGAISKKSVARMIGNAVPPKLGVALGGAMRTHVRQWGAREEKVFSDLEYA